MGSRVDAVSRYVWVPAVFALPGVLLLTSILTFRELGEMRAVYLRNRVATIAGRLENLPLSDFDTLYAEEPALTDLEIFERGTGKPGNGALEALWSGRELFRTEVVDLGGRRVFRAWVPFHSEGLMRVARIDLEASAADFLLRHARRNLAIAGLAGLVLVLLSLYTVWTARRAAELRHLAQLGKLSAVLAHEIRNPLGTIKGFAQLAGEKADTGVRALLEPVLEEVGRLERLVNDLLLYGRPVAPAVRETHWNPLAEQLEMNARQLVNGRRVKVAVEPADCRFQTDPDLLRRALLNLVRNAVEAAADSPGAAVRVAVAAHGGGAVVTVEDNGPGIPEKIRQRLFEPFHTTKASGTGLGLSITRKLAEALGGRLELRAAAPHGTRAELIFPHLKLEPADGNPTRG
jgi:two-component system sensor histidine kinase HydH